MLNEDDRKIINLLRGVCQSVVYPGGVSVWDEFLIPSVKSAPLVILFDNSGAKITLGFLFALI